MKKSKIMIVSALILCAFACVGVAFFTSRQEGSDKTFKIKKKHVIERDISWYDETKEEYILTTKEQLYGFAELSKSVDFLDKTVKLGGDIVVNEENAEGWHDEAPELTWSPIEGFSGVFDGQGYTISGLYCCGTNKAVGMFVDTATTCVIKNLRLVNTYFSGKGKKGIGGISGSGSGKFEKIYCETIIGDSGFNCGGIIGIAKDDICLSECWYAGNISATGNSGGMIGSFEGENGAIKHCLNSGYVSTDYRGTAGTPVGGIVGLCSGNLHIEDSLNVGSISSKISSEERGAICGQISNGVLTLNATWGTRESAELAIGLHEENGLIGTCTLRKEEQLTGYNGYQYTDLNFEEYWAVDLPGTPVLRCFVTDVPEVTGLTRICLADETWFDGTKSEYTISTTEELLGFSSLASKGNTFENITISLGANITFNTGDAMEYETCEPMNIWIPIKQFAGTFDGKGHTISGLYAVSKKGEHIGLFARTTMTANIRNLKVTNSYFCTDEGFLGGIVAEGYGAFTNIYTNVFLDRTLVSEKERGTGGIIGSVGNEVNKDVHVNEGYDLIVRNCWSDCYIQSVDQLNGGILGRACSKEEREVIIEHCLFTGTLMLEIAGAKDDKASAGIIGKTGNSASEGDYLVTDCLNAGTITAGSRATGCGGIVGLSGEDESVKCTIVTNCYSMKKGTNDLDGVVADSKGAELIDCDYVSLEELTGDNARTCTTLDFINHWQVINGNTPVLKVFTS